MCVCVRLLCDAFNLPATSSSSTNTDVWKFRFSLGCHFCLLVNLTFYRLYSAKWMVVGSFRTVCSLRLFPLWH